jgi:hypothetical protein
MKIEVGKAYKMRGGGKAVVTGCYGRNPFGSREPSYPFIGYAADGMDRTWNDCGQFYTDSPNNELDLVAEWREPRTWNYWLGVYDFHGDVMAVAYSTRPAIDRFFSMDSDRKVLSIKEVTVTEGVFA